MDRAVVTEDVHSAFSLLIIESIPHNCGTLSHQTENVVSRCGGSCCKLSSLFGGQRKLEVTLSSCIESRCTLKPHSRCRCLSTASVLPSSGLRLCWTWRRCSE